MSPEFQGTCMRRLLSTAILVLFATAAAAQAAEWSYEGGGVPIAYVDNGEAQFQFACRGGDLTMAFWVRKPHKLVAGAAAMNLSITPDGGGTSFAQDMPLIHSDGTSMVVRGPVARQWAKIAQQAKRSIGVAYVRTDGKRTSFDSNEFGAGGSSAAIKRVLERCG
jgi:hypothetical protein